EVLMGLVARVIGDGRVLGLLKRILDTHADAELRQWIPGGGLFDYETRRTGLPIGNLTSQFLANVYLNPLDHFAKHDLRVRGYVRYMDDFLLFGDDRGLLRKHGARIKDKLAELRLRMHPDKYRLTPTAKGVDFAGFVVFANGRVRVRSSSVRRFDLRYRRMLWEVNHKLRDPPAASSPCGERRGRAVSCGIVTFFCKRYLCVGRRGFSLSRRVSRP
ncbi:MAG: RNA-directed DNA polymerase, partial [Phycisphaerae bacterium]|nr:RNA-directed DNA polymerase [Phycisphaerae bacterium]